MAAAIVDHQEVLQQIKQAVPCRTKQIHTLLSLFGQKEHYSVPCIFAYGHTCTGKSYVIKSILEHLQLLHVDVDCVECFTSRLLYEHVINQLTGAPPSAENDYVTSIKCENMNDFVRLLCRVLTDRGYLDQTFYLVLHRAERLRDVDINILPALLKLQQLSGMNMTVILESEIVWEKFRGGTGFLEPVVMQFPDYSKEDLIEIMATDCPAEYPRTFYCTYLNLLLSVFHHACRNLAELRHLAQLNFPKYLEPIKSGECEQEDFRKLWRNIEPHLKKALQTVYLREVSSAQWERMQQEAVDQSAQPSQGLHLRHNVELPFYSKYLLIAAYFASYNPCKTDRRFFSKHSTKMSKRANLATAKRNERTSAQLLGPKPFPLDRLMAIFYCIVEDRVTPTANIFSQVTSLVSLGMMTQVASSDSLEAPKYKCLVNLDFIKNIGRSVNIDVIRYLYDFV